MDADNAQTVASTAVDRYMAGWNEFDPERRRALIAQAWSEDASYLDPHLSAHGHDGMDAMIGRAQTGFPGHSIALAAGPDAHNDRVRFTWHLVRPGAADPVAIGTDFAKLASDGRIREVTGFRGPLEPVV